MKKRVLSMALAALMLMSMLVVSASAAFTPVTLTVGSVSGQQGDIVEVPVTLSANSYLVNADIRITYDKTKLKLVEYYEGDEDMVCYSTENTILDSSWMYLGNEIKKGEFYFVGATGNTTGITKGGELFRLAFEILVDEDVDVTVNVSADPMRGNDGNGPTDANGLPADYNITPIVNKGKVTVEQKPTIILGDLTGEGVHNMLDVVALYNGVSGKLILTDTQKLAGDMDGNGVINMLDMVALYNKVAGK